MTVSQLLKILDRCDPETRVVTTFADHEYCLAKAVPGMALYDDASDVYTQDYGEQSTPESLYGKRIKVLIVS